MALAVAIRRRNLDQPRHSDEHGQFQSRLGIRLGTNGFITQLQPQRETEPEY